MEVLLQSIKLDDFGLGGVCACLCLHHVQKSDICEDALFISVFRCDSAQQTQESQEQTVVQTSSAAEAPPLGVFLHHVGGQNSVVVFRQ